MQLPNDVIYILAKINVKSEWLVWFILITHVTKQTKYQSNKQTKYDPPNTQKSPKFFGSKFVKIYYSCFLSLAQTFGCM